MIFSLSSLPFGRRSAFDNPAKTVWDILAESWGTSGTDAGVSVNEKSAMGYPAFFRGINIIASVVAKTPLIMYRRDSDDRKAVEDEPAYTLMKRKPNEQSSAYTMREVMQAQALWWGNSYAYIIREDGKPVELWLLNPQNTQPVVMNGSIWYVNTLSTGEVRKLRADTVLHIRGLGSDGIMGYNILDIARETLGLGIGLRKFGAVFFKNNASGGVVLEHPGKLKTETASALRESWAKMHEGLEKAHKTVILEDGMKAHPLSNNAKDSQLLESRQFEIREVANILGLPPHLLGDTTRTSYASLEQENQSFLDNSIDPWFSRWEAECNDKMLTPAQQETGYFFKFKREALVKVDLQKRYGAYKTAVETGFMSRNEVRRAEDMPSVPELESFVVPLNMQVLGEEPEEDEEPEPFEKKPEEETETGNDERHVTIIVDAHADLIEQAATRHLKRIMSQAGRAAKSPDNIVQWIENVRPHHEKGLSESIGPILRSLSTATGNETYTGAAGLLVNEFFGEIEGRMLDATECKPVELVGSIERAGKLALAEIPKAWRQSLLGCNNAKRVAIHN